MISQDVFESILRQWVDTCDLVRAVEDHGFSTWSYYKACAENPIYAKLRAQARRAIADVLASEIKQIADEDPDPQRAKNRMQARTWIASKYHREDYGDSVDLTVTGHIDVLAAQRQAALGRVLRPVSDQLDIEDAQVIEDKGQAVLPDPGQQPGTPGAANAATSKVNE